MGTESQVSVSVDSPEGIPAPTVILSFSPKDQAEFDAVVEAVGGPCAFHHFGESYAAATIEGASVHVNDPTGYSYPRPLSRRIQALKDACPSH